MYLLDTNVISELVRPHPDERVIAWVNSAPPLGVFISALTLGEIARGIALLPKGRRRQTLERWAAESLPVQFADRILPIDARTAAAWGALDAVAAREGRPLGVVDGLLLATAQAHALKFVTRNVAHCENRGVGVVDPWAA